MTMPRSHQVVEVWPQLTDDLYKYGVRDFLIDTTKGEPQMKFAGDFLTLPSSIREQAYRAAVSGSERRLLEFVKALAKELEKTLEINNSGNDEDEGRFKLDPQIASSHSIGRDTHARITTTRPTNTSREQSSGYLGASDDREIDTKDSADPWSDSQPLYSPNDDKSKKRDESKKDLGYVPSQTVGRNDRNKDPVDDLDPLKPGRIVNPYASPAQSASGCIVKENNTSIIANPTPTSTASGNKAIVTGNKSIIPENVVITPEDTTLTNGDKTMIHENKGTIARNDAVIPENTIITTGNRVIIPENRAVTPERKGILPENISITPEKNGIPPKNRAMTLGDKVTTLFSGGIPLFSKVITLEERVTTPENKGIPPNNKATSLQNKVIAPGISGPWPKANETGTGAPIPGPGQNGPQTQLRTVEYYYHYLNDFINKNLGPFEFDEATKQDLALRAVKVAEEIKDEYGMMNEQVGPLARLSLFDIFILCDNSGSMILGNRIETLNKTLQSVAHWATRIEKDGISLRFLNKVNDGKGRFDRLTDLNQIDDLICNIPIGGNTRLGTMLNSKVIQPLIELADRRAQQKREAQEDEDIKPESIRPRIILIITDGQPQGEDRQCLRNEILAAKHGKLGTAYGQAATIFIITRVGSDREAMEFIVSLKADDEVKDLILSEDDQLEDIIDSLISEENRKGYEKYLLNMFLDAVHGQTS